MVPKPFSSIIYAILLRPLCNHNAREQYSLLNGEGSNLEAYQREVITFVQTTCHSLHVTFALSFVQ